MTMRNHTKKRLDHVELVIGSQPVPPHRSRPAFDHFKQTGELPEDDRVARVVVQRAKDGRESATDIRKVDWAAEIMARVNEPPRPADPIMNGLYNEAVNAPPFVREAARLMLKALASAGFDVTEPQFLNGCIKPPEYGSVGLHLMGVPERLVRPPYRRQATRLLKRIDLLRPRLPHENPKWFEQLGQALDAFQLDGERPHDDLMLQAVLAVGEINTLMRHLCKEDVGDAMAAFDEVARAKATGREAAIGRLQQMARAGRFAGRDE